VLAVDDCRHNPDDFFASAQAAEQAEDIAEAERFYRFLMKGFDPLAAFNLGNVLRAHGRNLEAEAALRAAVPVVRHLRKQGTILAIKSTSRDVPKPPSMLAQGGAGLAPDYSDAMFNLALLLQRVR